MTVAGRALWFLAATLCLPPSSMGVRSTPISRSTVEAAFAASRLPQAAKTDAQHPHFDVVSIRPSNPDEHGFSIRPQVDRFAVTGADLVFLVSFAYDLHEFQVVNAVDWEKSKRYDIVGKMDDLDASDLNGDQSAKTSEQKQVLLRERVKALLAERFKLRVHTDTRLLPTYDLFVESKGAKLQASKENTGYTFGPGRLTCSAFSMSNFADYLSSDLDRVVVDKTGITGEYQFSLKWSPDETSDSTLPGLFTALKEQLGLKLEPSKDPVPVVVIDSAEQASAN